MDFGRGNHSAELFRIERSGCTLMKDTKGKLRLQGVKDRKIKDKLHQTESHHS